ncbi:hypothetical protein K449DRAFT_466078 [Hypoxylon sp. EC38]|nr:hypothetical protein K449DRAFT_466078 [Hypoxylon sp. EC38]
MAPRTRSSVKASEKKTEGDTVPATSNAVETTNASVQEELVSPSGKRKSTEDANDSNDDDGAPSDQEATIPKRQRLAVRTRDDQSTEKGRKTYLEVEIPSSATPKWPRSSAVPDSQDVDGLSDSDPEAEPSSASKQLEEEASQKLASQSVEPDLSPVPKPKSKHVVFGDDDDVEKFVAAAAATEANKKTENGNAKDEEEGSDEDDDDAPEAVSTQAIAKEMQKAALAASEAAEKQAASLKRKRQEKDSLYKQQAERRKRARGTVEVHQNKATSKDEASSDEQDDDGIAEVETAVTTGRRRAQKFNLPTVLPAEFLTDSSEDEDEDESTLKKRVVKKPKKINFETGGKRPRDQVVGSTRYRVLADQADQKLAPRIRKQARVFKESLLKRKRSGAATGAGMKKGFFVRR